MKDILLKILCGVIGLYFMTVLFIFTPYYNWNYVKEYGFKRWLYFGEVTATAKAIAWPYFVFTSSRDSILHASKAIEHFNKATIIINKNRYFQKISQSDMITIIEHYKEALAEGRKADIRDLNNYFPEFGDHFKREFIQGIELFIKSRETDDKMSSINSEAFLDHWSDWFSKNIEAIRGN